MHGWGRRGHAGQPEGACGAPSRRGNGRRGRPEMVPRPTRDGMRRPTSLRGTPIHDPGWEHIIVDARWTATGARESDGSDAVREESLARDAARSLVVPHFP